MTEASALDWSVIAMDDMTRRLPLVRARDRARALAIIGEVVWQVTIVDATLVRYYPDRYDDVLAAEPQAARCRIEGTLSGLRFVRNRLRDEAGDGDFVRWPVSSGPAPARSPRGRGSRCPSLPWTPCRRAGGRGKPRGTATTGSSWPAARSARPSAGPRPSWAGRPRP